MDDFLNSLAPDYSLESRELIARAYRVAEEAHSGQFRVSGDPYFSHCEMVATILADMLVPANVIAAGLLHDTVEDTPLTLADIERDFGADIARMVDSVTKLTQLPRVSRDDQRPEDEIKEQEARQAAERRGEQPPDDVVDSLTRSRGYDATSETLRKTFLAMGDDVRVVLIKLADRLHNMRTLRDMPPHKQKRISQQTMDIFAPLAGRLGIWQFNPSWRTYLFSTSCRSAIKRSTIIL